MEDAYAEVLWRLMESGRTPHMAVKALQTILRRHGRESLLPRIGRAFAKRAERHGKRNDVVLSLAREKDARKAHKEIKDFITKLGVEIKDLKTQIDDTQIGGWRLEGKDTLVDASFKKQLLDVYNRSTV